MPQISVIVPVYKVEQYLPACVDSILAQTFPDFELILVDDGSPDKCGEICDAYAERDHRVYVIHRENGGLSAARNTGIDAATGKYITFVDSDDLVDKLFLASMYQTAEDCDSDLVTSWLVPFADGSAPKPIRVPEKRNVIIRNGAEAARVLYEGNDSVIVTACAKLFRTRLIGETRFPVGRLHEDQAVIPILCYRANRVVTFQTPLYYYRNRQDSITSSNFSLRRYDDIKSIDECIAFFAGYNETAIIQAAKEKRMRQLCIYSIEAAYHNLQVPPEYKVPKRRALRYIKRHVSAQKYEYCLFRASPLRYRFCLYRKRILHKIRKLFLKKQ